MGRPADTLYKTDEQIAKELGVPLATWCANAVVLERHGLPKPDLMFGDMRYWPAVKAFLDRRYDLAPPSRPPLAPDGEEKRHGRRPAETPPQRRNVRPLLGGERGQPAGG